MIIFGCCCDYAGRYHAVIAAYLNVPTLSAGVLNNPLMEAFSFCCLISCVTDRLGSDKAEESSLLAQISVLNFGGQIKEQVSSLICRIF